MTNDGSGEFSMLCIVEPEENRRGRGRIQISFLRRLYENPHLTCTKFISDLVDVNANCIKMT